MNEKEAREIIALSKKMGQHDHSLEEKCADCKTIDPLAEKMEGDFEEGFSSLTVRAQGYLACLEGPEVKAKDAEIAGLRGQLLFTESALDNERARSAKLVEVAKKMFILVKDEWEANGEDLTQDQIIAECEGVLKLFEWGKE